MTGWVQVQDVWNKLDKKLRDTDVKFREAQRKIDTDKRVEQMMFKAVHQVLENEHGAAPSRATMPML